MSDIVDQLRAHRQPYTKPHTATVCQKAADEIDSLTRELAEARNTALEDAAKVAGDAFSQIEHRSNAKAAGLVIAAAIRSLKDKP